jgi:Uma2 family endonuclease
LVAQHGDVRDVRDVRISFAGAIVRVRMTPRKRSMSTHIEPLLTIADLDAMPEDDRRYEIIEGELFVSCAPDLDHQNICLNIAVDIRHYLSSNPIGKIWITPGVILSEYSGVVPDLVFVGNELLEEIASGKRITGAPDLAIEVISPGAENDRRDRIVKRHLYGKHGVKEYWAVDPRKRRVEVYVLKEQTLQHWRSYAEQDEPVSSVLPAFTYRVANVFRS